MPHLHSHPGSQPSPSAAALNAASRRAALRSENSRAARGALVEALIALADEELAHGREAATVEALAEAGTLFPKRVPSDPAWRGRYVMLHRTKAALAQRQERQADAVEAYEAALSVIPSDLETASRDDNAARLQLLVRLARSRLAVGEAQRVAAEMLECGSLLGVLDGKIPARALDAVRAAVLGHTGVAKAMLGDAHAAGEKLGESLALLDRLAAPELADLRRQVLNALSNVMRQGGGGASALLLSDPPKAAEELGESCGCGDPHPHDHAHCAGQNHHHHNDHHDHSHGHAHHGHSHKSDRSR